MCTSLICDYKLKVRGGRGGGLYEMTAVEHPAASFWCILFACSLLTTQSLSVFLRAGLSSADKEVWRLCVTPPYLGGCPPRFWMVCWLNLLFETFRRLSDAANVKLFPLHSGGLVILSIHCWENLPLPVLVTKKKHLLEVNWLHLLPFFFFFCTSPSFAHFIYLLQSSVSALLLSHNALHTGGVVKAGSRVLLACRKKEYLCGRLQRGRVNLIVMVDGELLWVAFITTNPTQ